MRVYLRRLDALGARYPSLDASADASALAATIPAEAAHQLAPSFDPPARARVVLSAELAAGVTLPADTLAGVEGVEGDHWRTLRAAVNASADVASVRVEAESVAAGRRLDGGAAAGTITARVSAVVGWFSVSNPSPSTAGSYGAPRDPREPRPVAPGGPPSVPSVRWWPPSARQLALELAAAPLRRLRVGALPPAALSHGLSAELDALDPSAPPSDLWAPGEGETPGHFTPAGGPPRRSWRVVLPLAELGTVPRGALVFVDPASLDGELQGSGRAWVPALVTGSGRDARVPLTTRAGVSLSARAARVPLAALPPLARARAVSGGGEVVATLEPTAEGGGALVFALDGAAGGFVPCSVVALSDLPPPLAGDPSRVTMAELDAARWPGRFVALV